MSNEYKIICSRIGTTVTTQHDSAPEKNRLHNSVLLITMAIYQPHLLLYLPLLLHHHLLLWILPKQLDPTTTSTPMPAAVPNESSGGRAALLSSIQGFSKNALKKTETKDSSAPKV
ncbi:hypothetical protein CEXT_713121 [Caerostris extrusa]|uniref:WH2 domain-containing protein n=1 Tax=Caerostris extrusa TaxID=172846 RepID=A0AAV4Q196_CAEEX|nr:hypothetical protein CEXT_713121 [Caerostris extrusa]